MARRGGETYTVTVRARVAFDTIPNQQHTMSSPPLPECRRRTLKYINSRPVLIAICALVVIECACVLAELMVDLQGIKFRFENEENELNRFVDYLKDKYPEQFASFEGRTMEDVIYRIQGGLVLHSEKELDCQRCPCACSDQTGSTASDDPNTAGSRTSSSEEIDKTTKGQKENNEISQKPPANFEATYDNAKPAALAQIFSDTGANAPDAQAQTGLDAEGSNSGNKSAPPRQFSIEDLFVLEINNVKESFFLVAEYAPEHTIQNDTKHSHYNREYARVHKASTTLHVVSLVILSFMVVETMLKLLCMGIGFLKKRFEVFDAFIVISSFALDFVFLDSRWYETGKDATTILVLLLPWRVVRIVNSFLLTLKHKHHIEMMNMKRAKKRADFKNAKLQTLLTEIRKDVQLLVALCRNSHVPEAEITSCLYGLGRRSTTLTAVTSCTTIMLVSALGKDAPLEDEIYGRLFADALRDPAELEDAEPEVKKAEEEAIDAAIELDKQIEQQNKKARSTKPRSSKRRPQVTRSYTVPRRSASIDNAIEAPSHLNTSESNGNVFYVNDGFGKTKAGGKAAKNGVASADTLSGIAGEGGLKGDGGGGNGTGQPCKTVAEASATKEGEESPEGKDSWEGRLPPKYHSKASVRSLPGPGPGQNYVTFEVTTQVTYL